MILRCMIVVVGVNTYKIPKYCLNYANADARAFEAAMKAEEAVPCSIIWLLPICLMKMQLKTTLSICKVIAAAKTTGFTGVLLCRAWGYQ